MKEALIFGFDIDSYAFYKRNYPEIDIVGWFGDTEHETTKDLGVTFEDQDLYHETRMTDKPRAVVHLRHIDPKMVPDSMPVPVVNSFVRVKHYEDLTHQVYWLEAMLDKTVVRSMNVLCEPGVLVGAHTTLSQGVTIKTLGIVRENCCLGALTEVGARSYIEPGCIIGSRVKIGEDVWIAPGTVIPDKKVIPSGERVNRNDF